MVEGGIGGCRLERGRIKTGGKGGLIIILREKILTTETDISDDFIITSERQPYQ